MDEQKHSITGTTRIGKITIEINEEGTDSAAKYKKDAQTLHHIFKENIPSETYYELEKLFLLEIMKEREGNE